MEYNKVYLGDAIESIRTFPDECIDCVVTSPPYYGLRDYGTGTWEGGDPKCDHEAARQKTRFDYALDEKQQSSKGTDVKIYDRVCPICGAVRVDRQIGLEDTPEAYIERLVSLFREIRRCLKKDGTLWVNLGDSYATGTTTRRQQSKNHGVDANNEKAKNSVNRIETPFGCKAKDLLGIPWMFAFAMRADGWYLRQDIIWCLSGGAYIYVKSQKGVMPMMVRDMVRLDPSTIQLWNGKEWVNVLGYGESSDTSEKLELVLRSGERIGCTGGHKWLLEDGREIEARDLKPGMVLKRCTLPESDTHRPQILDDDTLWFFGIFLAEGSYSDDCIQLSLNADEFGWVERIGIIAKRFGGTHTYSISGNNLCVRVYSQVLFAALHQYIGGHDARTKHLNNIVWSMPNDWLSRIACGYFDGDGHYDNGRIRLGFTRNYELERDLRVLAARLGASVTIKSTFSFIGEKKYPSFRGEWRWKKSGHHNEKEQSEIVEIRRSRARHFYDISVDGEDHLFSLASGVLTHNCKPNPMPESVTDRCTKSHEYIFLFSKSDKYYFDYESIQEEAVTQLDPRIGSRVEYDGLRDGKEGNGQRAFVSFKVKGKVDTPQVRWGSGTKKERTHEQNYSKDENGGYRDNSGGFDCEMSIKDGVVVRNKRDVWTVNVRPNKEAHFATYPQELIVPCILAGSRENGVVLDPFMGSGTTGIVARKLNRNFVGCELNPEYQKMAERRIFNEGENLFNQ